MAEDDPISPEELDDESLRDNVILRSNISTTRVGAINIKEEKHLLCPTCQNTIDDKNRRLVCEMCGTTTFCQACDRIMTRTRSYEGYVLNYDWPLCRTCYRKVRDGQISEIKAGKLGNYRKEDEVPIVDQMEPILETDDPEGMGRKLGLASVVLGIASLFLAGFILGPAAIITGYMARVRKNRLGTWGMAIGALGIATSLFWVIISGGYVWFF